MSRSRGILGVSLAVAALTLAGDREAAACGGCFHPPPPPNQTSSDITDERMLLSVSTLQSTLYDQILYSGNPTSFAWVLPIVGTVDVGLSADVLFDSMDALTATQIVAPPYPCAPPPFCGNVFAGTAAASGTTAATGVASPPPPVTVTKQENVGPYATVQLQSTDAGALEAWLAQNGFVIPTDVQPVIAAYVTEGFNFLAMKLLPNQGVQAMRPVRVTTHGASLSLPLRMASIGTGAVVGITIWVVADGRYEPQNFPFFHIDDSQLVWDWSTNLSNYTTLRAQNESGLGGKGWEIESSLTLNQQVIANTILSGGQYSQNGGFGAPLTPTNASDDYLAAGDPDAGTDGGYQSADDVRTADVAALFAGLTGSNARVTRFRGDIAHAAMDKDLKLQASADQSELSNVRNVTQSVNANCPVYPPCSQGGFGSGTTTSTSGSTFGQGTTTSTSGSPFGSVTPGGASYSSGSDHAAPVPNQGQLDGCTASARPRGGLAAELGAMAAIGGLVVARLARGRRKKSQR
jgi:hypothetical protein